MRTHLAITPNLSLPLSELEWSFDRSPGPGGQNVNKLSTRAELRFDVVGSPSLSEEQRRRLRSALHDSIGRDGRLAVRSSRHRRQLLNREDCLAKLAALLARALRPPPPRRRPTRPSRTAQARRLERKRRHAAKKAARRSPSW